MQHRPVIIVVALVMSATAWLVSQTSPTKRESTSASDDWIAASRFEFEAFADDSNMPEPDLSDDESASDIEPIRNFSQEERAEYVQAFGLKEIAKDFPIHVGMTISEMDDAIEENERRFDESELKEMYNLGWEHRSIKNESGWVYFWVNFKRLFHCNVVIRSGKIQSVWVMPGNKEWSTGIYYRISGSGVHKGPGRIW